MWQGGDTNSTAKSATRNTCGLVAVLESDEGDVGRWHGWMLRGVTPACEVRECQDTNLS
jgi:hypothetical protein